MRVICKPNIAFYSLAVLMPENILFGLYYAHNEEIAQNYVDLFILTTSIGHNVDHPTPSCFDSNITKLDTVDSNITFANFCPERGRKREAFLLSTGVRIVLSDIFFTSSIPNGTPRYK